MTYFSHHWITDRICRIVDYSETALYLVVGDERAMLVDTGSGLASLRAYVDELTDLPYDVLLTHGHVDHASGAAEFTDKTIWLHPADRELMSHHTAFEKRIDYQENVLHRPVERALLVPQMDPELTEPLSDGQRFGLGGLHLEAIHVPGHTHGMCMVLIEEERFILFGDGCGVNVMILEDEATSVEEYRAALVSLKAKHEGRYDHIIRNHGTCVSPKVLLDNVIECCDEVLAGTDDAFPAPPHALPVSYPDTFFAKEVSAATHGRADGEQGNLAYRPGKVRKNIADC